MGKSGKMENLQGNDAQKKFLDQKPESPQAKSEILGFSPKATSPQAFQKVSSPPGRSFGKILISPQNFGEK